MTPSAPGAPWTPEELSDMAGSRELEIATARGNGAPEPWTPIWVVVVDGDVFVRTWYRRETGWYGRAVRSGRSRIRLADESIDVLAAVTGDAASDDIDTAYRTKYGMRGAQSMVTAEAVATTLRLTRAP